VKIHRSRPEARFTIIPDETLRDARLSYLARGVLAEILSRPDDWRTSADAIAARARTERGRAGEGRDKIRAIFAELEACGYLQRTRRRGPGGRIVTDLHIYDVLAGRTDDDTGSTSVPPGQTPVPAGRTHDGSTDRRSAGAPVDQASVGQASVLRPSTEIEKKTDHEDGSLSRIAAALRAAVPDVTEREARQIIASTKSNPHVRAPVPYLTAAIANGDAAALVAEARDQLVGQERMDRIFAEGPAAANGHPPGRRSAACRSNDHEHCVWSWCECSCSHRGRRG
jgi:hypothetical protein